MELTQSMFATSAEYWKARAELAEGTIAELAEELKCEPDNERMLQAVHNLNWALGTPGYAEMATPEEQAEHVAAVGRVDYLLARMAENKRKHDAAMKDAKRYRWLRYGDNDERCIRLTGHGEPYMLRGELLDRCVDEGMAADAAEEAHTVEGPGVGAA